MITYRALRSEEWPKLAPIFSEYGVDTPNSALARAVVAEDDDRIVGFLVLQPWLHAEPIWIDEQYRTRVRWSSLAEKMGEMLSAAKCNVYVFAQENTEVMAERAGFKKLPVSVWVKELGG